ncbi:MAG: BrnT family toxin [Treponema sp.]|jgi:uncharacterized DUF497 family protein|nr:BrnT family toxin [Treponema sp.]
MDIEFEWDEEKNRINIRDHGLSLADGEDVFYDPFRTVRPDDDSGEGEDRWQTMGMAGKVLFVVYTERGEKTRIISVRIAEPFERRIYYGNRNTYPQGWRRINP